MRALFDKRLTFFVLVAIVLAMTVGGVYTAQIMTMDGDMMHHCPFMGVPALCGMSPLAHLIEWQLMFTAVLQQMTASLSLLALFFALVLAWQYVRQLLVPKRTEIFIPRYRDTERILDPLKLAFARGIIHPKVF